MLFFVDPQPFVPFFCPFDSTTRIRFSGRKRGKKEIGNDGLIKIPIRGNGAGRGPILEIMSICSGDRQPFRVLLMTSNDINCDPTAGKSSFLVIHPDIELRPAVPLRNHTRRNAKLS